MVTLIGLGNQREDITFSAKAALDGATKIIARTRSGGAFESLEGYDVEYLDDIYEKSRNFDTLNKNLAKRVIQASKSGDVIYCVDGAVSEDEGCKILLSRVKDIKVIEGVSKISRVKCAAKLKSSAVCSLSAYAVDSLKSCPAAVVYDIDDGYAASEVKRVLSDLFGEETECAFVRGDAAKRIKIYEIDRQSPYGADCAVAVEEGEFLKKERYDFADLERMIRMLRAPGGCPWDRVQTNASIRQNMIEEAYELVDAVNRDDDAGLEEECGDVLLQAAFHAVMKEEQGAFNGTDALTGIVKKLIFRHSHIFGGDRAASENEALGVWENNKRKEKHQETFGDSVLAVPNNFPACMRAQKVGKRAAKSGMDFASAGQASQKLGEEAEELLSALASGNGAQVEEEAGDLLFSAVNVCRLAGVDCEQALTEATEKFLRRFVMCENLVLADGKDITALGAEELDTYWERAKDALKEH